MKKGTRITLTKKAQSSEYGQLLLDFLIELSEDGEITESEVRELSEWLASTEYPEDIPAYKYLHIVVLRSIIDGVVTDDERYEIQTAILRILPKKFREEAEEKASKVRMDYWRSKARLDNPATDRQLEFLRDLGADCSVPMSKMEASELIDDLLSKQPPRPSNRQMMVLRFWNRLDLQNRSVDEVSLWMDRWYDGDPDRQLAWELWKEENNDDGSRSRDVVNRVPIGIGPSYLQRVKGGGGTGLGCLVLACALLSAGSGWYMIVS